MQKLKVNEELQIHLNKPAAEIAVHFLYFHEIF